MSHPLQMDWRRFPVSPRDGSPLPIGLGEGSGVRAGGVERAGGRGRLFLLAWLFLAPCAFAHDPGLSTAVILVSPDKLEVTLILANADARQLVESDNKNAAQIPTDELSMTTAIQLKVPEAVEIKFDGRIAKPTVARCDFDKLRNLNVYLSFPAIHFSELAVRSKWLALLPPGHREFLTIQGANDEILAERLLSANSDTLTVHLGAEKAPAPARQSFLDFLLMGIKHIWTGYDHLLFLFGLLVVTRNFAGSVKIITCFTIAHSITLAVATLSLVQISSRIVEPLIAVSIVYVGVENLVRGGDPKGRWLLTFAFGLIHGFGFASVLRELGVGANGSGIAVPLVSFNAGVEIGQVAIAAVVLPLFWKLRMNPSFLHRWVPAASAAVVVLGSYWFVQRVWF